MSACERTCLVSMKLRCSAPGHPVPSVPLSYETQTQTLHSAAPSLPAILVQVPQSLWHATFCSSCTAGLSGNTLHFHYGFFVGRTPVRVSMGSLPYHASAPPLKKSLCGTHTAAPSHGLALCALPKSRKSLMVKAVQSFRR